MIEHVRFLNFKGLRKVDLDLEPLTVIVGPNASGKTSILEGLYRVSSLLHESFEQQSKFAPNPHLFYSCGGTGNLELEVRAGDCQLKVVSPFPHTSVSNGHPPANTQSAQKHFEYAVLTKRVHQPDEAWAVVTPKSSLPLLAGPTVLLCLEPGRLAAPSYSAQPVLQLERDGYGLPSLLANLKLKHDAEFRELEELLRKVIPFIQRVRIDRVPIVRLESESVTFGTGENLVRHVAREYGGDALILDMEGTPGIPGELVSEGTLLVLGMVALLMAPGRPKLLLLDDLDRGLHPKAQGGLIALLRGLLGQHKDLQIIATTHSPYLLDHLEAKEVRLTERRSDGSVACARLDEHPKFEKWKEEMTPGEFWSHVGEKWVAERQVVEIR